jgi:CRP-like cAMP-binding protein
VTTPLLPERIDQLRAIGLFRSCSDAELALIDELVDDIEVEPSETLAWGGAMGALFAILSGEASSAKEGEAPTALGPGDTFGATRAPEDEHPAVTATTAMRILVIDPVRLREIVDLGEIAQRVLHEALARARSLPGADPVA